MGQDRERMGEVTRLDPEGNECIFTPHKAGYELSFKDGSNPGGTTFVRPCWKWATWEDGPGVPSHHREEDPQVVPQPQEMPAARVSAAPVAQPNVNMPVLVDQDDGASRIQMQMQKESEENALRVEQLNKCIQNLQG